MTQPPKKYRKKVSDKRVEVGAKRIRTAVGKKHASFIARQVLEADAEVIDVYPDRLLTNLEQFNAEWEEINDG
jgi:HJR/Mrr/RecB family endonuclease